MNYINGKGSIEKMQKKNCSFAFIKTAGT